MTSTTLDTAGLGKLPLRRRLTNGWMSFVVYFAFALAVIPLVWLSVTVVERGVDRFMVDSNGDANFNLDFLQQSMRGVFGGMPEGGILHAIWGTLLITIAATVISVPIGLLTAIYIVEYGNGWLKKAVTFFVDVMTGIPSIVAGLFAYALFAIVVGPGTKTGFVGAVALSVLMIPVVVRSSEEMLRLVPNELREASYALGVPKWLTILKVVVRTAIAGIATGVTLAIARVIGETAPLLVAVGVADSMNLNLFDGRMMALPVYIVSEWRKGVQPCNDPSVACVGEITEYRAWAAALVLILIVMALNLIARLISRYFSPKTGR
ncbi:phosphate ABC transporter permease PstA [Demequina zhanjiangensis]|uniref:Phosphate transport system permease protein PstA n=1 Tax=Demequina zhanjiangensis TaxID=3051659 RepID=A0ABT8FYK8_9MICO|nr:phosphate ABC transporter permease PstA [Demequina sp. SYSU T00b26]MDN4471970.1 phosphate ABC transporter permease PstA [Demequina sp. SYSU T00b26]